MLSFIVSDLPLRSGGLKTNPRLRQEETRPRRELSAVSVQQRLCLLQSGSEWKTNHNSDNKDQSFSMTAEFNYVVNQHASKPGLFSVLSLMMQEKLTIGRFLNDLPLQLHVIS